MGTVRRQKAKAERLFKSACEFYDKNDFQKAASLFEGLLSEDAGVCRIQDLELWLAACYLESEDYQKAAPLLDELLEEVSPVEEPARYGHVLSLAGECCSYNGSFETAVALLERLEHYAQALTRDGKTWLLYEGRVARGHSLICLGKPEDALKTFELAEQGVPDGQLEPPVKSLLDYRRAVALHHLGDREQAVRLLEAATPSKFSNKLKREYWFLRAQLHEWIKEHDKALLSFNNLEALGIPDSLKAEAHHWAGRAYYYSGKGPESVQHFRESLKHSTDCAWIEESSSSYLDELKKAGWV